MEGDQAEEVVRELVSLWPDIVSDALKAANIMKLIIRGLAARRETILVEFRLLRGFIMEGVYRLSRSAIMEEDRKLCDLVAVVYSTVEERITPPAESTVFDFDQYSELALDYD